MAPKYGKGKTKGDKKKKEEKGNDFILLFGKKKLCLINCYLVKYISLIYN